MVDETQMTNEEMLLKIEAATKKLEDADRKFQQNMIRAEEMKIANILGGSAEAGTPAVVETDREYALRILSGK